MASRVRTRLHRALTSTAGDALTPVRVTKDLARRLNTVLGQPLCSFEELERRRAGKERLEALRSGKAAPAPTTTPKVAAPVMVYFDHERNARLLGRVEELLTSKNIPFTKLDVNGDASTKDFVCREAKCKDDDLPIVFVAGVAIGDYNALVDADVSGRLAKAVWG